MTVLSMKCISVMDHPNADALKIYEFQDIDNSKIQVVANLENVYKPGDIVIVVKAGSKLKTGESIKVNNVRGIKSYGMALGFSSEPYGTDLTDKYCNPGVYFTGWPSIENLHNVYDNALEYNNFQKITYRAKCKLDGTNAGVQLLTDGQIIPQSRSKIISIKDDNLGFAKWCTDKKELFSQIRKKATEKGYGDIVLFGEFCGKGIQKRTSISKLDRKILAIFAIQIGLNIPHLEIDPLKIKEIIPESNDIYIISWYGNKIILDFANKEDLKKQVDLINQEIEKIEPCDPWVKDTFGIEGICEGLVYYPILDNDINI
ncbi:MAG: hypothetical protein HC877_23335 [Thioploca sp.]|nr:hypothetical protein [Thioploca sp.]